MGATGNRASTRFRGMRILGQAGARLTQRHLALRSASTAGKPKVRAVASGVPNATHGRPKRFQCADTFGMGLRGMASQAGGKEAAEEEEDLYKVCTWS